MKKIIIAFDGNHFSEGAFEFARRLNELHPILLTGVFLTQAELANTWSLADSMNGPYIPLIESNEAALIAESISRFEKLCQQNTIDYRIHNDGYDFSLPVLKKESRYADLLILGSERFYQNLNMGSPNDYLRKVFHNVLCPVLAVPEKFGFPENIILAYDGSEDSIYAIKQFAYLFPEFTGKKTLLIYASQEEGLDFPDKIEMEELVARHFKDLTLFKLGIDPEEYFGSWMFDRTSSLMVCGSYGRSDLSRLIHGSFVNEVIADHRLPVFIAHQ